MLKKLKNNWFFVITLLLSLGAVLFAISQTGGIDNFILVVKNTDRFWLVMAFVLVLLYWFCDAVTLHILIVHEEKKYNFLNSIYVAMLGFLYCAVTPFASGGQPMQVYEMNKTGMKTGSALSVISIKSVIYQLGLIIFGAVSVILTWRFFSGAIQNFGWFLTLGFIFNIIFTVIIVLVSVNAAFTLKLTGFFIKQLSKFRIIKNYEKTYTTAAKQIELFNTSIKNIKDQKLGVTISFGITFLQLVLFFSIPYCIYRSFHLTESTFVYMVTANSLITLISTFAPTPGGSGAAEGSFYLFFSLFFTKTLLFPAVFIWRGITYYLCLIIGMIITLARMLFKKKV